MRDLVNTAARMLFGIVIGVFAGLFLWSLLFCFYRAALLTARYFGG